MRSVPVFRKACELAVTMGVRIDYQAWSSRADYINDACTAAAHSHIFPASTRQNDSQSSPHRRIVACALETYRVLFLLSATALMSHFLRLNHTILKLSRQESVLAFTSLAAGLLSVMSQNRVRAGWTVHDMPLSSVLGESGRACPSSRPASPQCPRAHLVFVPACRSALLPLLAYITLVMCMTCVCVDSF